MTDRFRISSLLAPRLAEHKLAPPALLRRAGLPAGFLHEERISATTAEVLASTKGVPTYEHQ